VDVGWELEEIGEAELLEGVVAGRVVDCEAGGTRRRVDAELLRRCCHEFKSQVDPRGIRLRNAAITGLVDLAGLDVPYPLRFEDCEFDSPLVVEGAQLYDLAVTRCVRVPGLLANGVRVRRDLDLSGSHVAGEHKTTASSSRSAAVWLCESEIGGRLLCVGSTLDAGSERAMQADRMHVGGTVRFLHDFTARGQMRLLGAQIDGSLDLTGAQISGSGDGVALDLSDAAIGGNIFLIGGSRRRLEVHGRLDLNNARISGQLLVRDATLAAPASTPVKGGYARLRAGGVALSAQRLTMGADIAFESGCDIRGGIDLSMSSMSSLLIDSGCTLASPGKTALDLTNAEILSGVMIGEGVPVEGTLRLVGVTIHGNLCLRGTRLSSPEAGFLVAAEGARIDGQVEIQKLEAECGELAFRTAVVGSAIDASGARLHNPEGYTLSLAQAKVNGSVRLTYGFESRGKVVLNRAIVAGRLLCTEGTFECPRPTARNRRGHAIEVISASITGGMNLGWQSVSPSVDFTNARTTYLADDPARWPAHFLISGFSYERLEQPQGLPHRGTWDHAARSAWLRRQAGYDAGPYEQAARVFRQHGYPRGAQEILIAQRRHARSAMTGRGAAARRALDGAYSLTVAYGFRPARVIWAIAALLVLVTVTLQVPGARAEMRATTSSGAVYTLTGPLQPGSGSASAQGPLADACGDGQVRCFNPVLYAIDTVIPLVSLDQRSTWYPDNGSTAGVVMQWWLNAATILGWLLSSVFVLALANLARSD
jgi:hypothetical protein